MRVCHTVAMKAIKEYEEQKRLLLETENRNCITSYKETEKKLTNDYNYAKVRKDVQVIDEKIRKIKAILAYANATVKVDTFDITIGEALVLLAQLQKEKDQVEYLSSRTQLTRRITPNGVLEYTECCYDVEKAKADAIDLRNKISNLQIAIDRANLTNYIEI